MVRIRYLLDVLNWNLKSDIGWKQRHDVPVANMAVNLGAGVVAGTAATCITQPFDMIKTRMQLDRKLYRTTWSTAKRVFMVKDTSINHVIV